MNTEKLLKDVIKAIDKWRVECIKQGKDTVCVSQFVTFNSKDTEVREIERSAHAVFGTQKDIIVMTNEINKFVGAKDEWSSMLEKKAAGVKLSGRELVLEQIMKTANGEDIMHVKQVPNSGKKRLSTLNVIKTKKVKK